MKTLVQYLILVVAVLIAIYAVLKLGETQQALPSMCDNWRLSRDNQWEPEEPVSRQ